MSIVYSIDEVMARRNPRHCCFMAVDLHKRERHFSYTHPFMMKSFFPLCAAIVIGAASAVAQDTTHGPWKHTMIASLNLSQVSFTHWSQGGTNTLSYLAGVNGKSERDEATTHDRATRHRATRLAFEQLLCMT